MLRNDSSQKSIGRNKIEHDHQCRLRKKLENQQLNNCSCNYLPTSAEMTTNYKISSSSTPADIEFSLQFLQNPFGYAFSICNCLWFKNDLSKISDKNYDKNILIKAFLAEDISNFEICALACN